MTPDLRPGYAVAREAGLTKKASVLQEMSIKIIREMFHLGRNVDSKKFSK